MKPKKDSSDKLFIGKLGKLSTGDLEAGAIYGKDENRRQKGRKGGKKKTPVRSKKGRTMGGGGKFVV